MEGLYFAVRIKYISYISQLYEGILFIRIFSFLGIVSDLSVLYWDRVEQGGGSWPLERNELASNLLSACDHLIAYRKITYPCQAFVFS